MRRSQVVIIDLFSSDRMRVVEWDDAGVGPQHPLLNDLVRSDRIFRVRLRRPWDVILLGVCPASLKIGVPEREVAVPSRRYQEWSRRVSRGHLPEQFPGSVLLDIFILVQATFPPLGVTTRVLFLDTLVSTGGHQGAKSAPSMGLCVTVDYVLEHRVIQQESIDGTVAASDKILLEASLVQTADASLASVARAEKLDISVGMVGEHVDNLVKKEEVNMWRRLSKARGQS